MSMYYINRLENFSFKNGSPNRDGKKHDDESHQKHGDENAAYHVNAIVRSIWKRRK